MNELESNGDEDVDWDDWALNGSEPMSKLQKRRRDLLKTRMVPRHEPRLGCYCNGPCEQLGLIRVCRNRDCPRGIIHLLCLQGNDYPGRGWYCPVVTSALYEYSISHKWRQIISVMHTLCRHRLAMHYSDLLKSFQIPSRGLTTY